MRIVIAGGTGFLGRALIAALERERHHAIVLTRHPQAPRDVAWNPTETGHGEWTRAVDAADAVINLAGEGIADRRWTTKRKAALHDSRIAATRALVGAINGAPRRPPVFLSSSAIGIYGDRGDEIVTEQSSPGTDFLASLCSAWEHSATDVDSSVRRVLLRTGVVLARDGGALPQLALPFRLFAGGRLGSGQQFVSWIHRDDWIAMVLWALSGKFRDRGRGASEEDRVAGPLNLVAPEPVRNAELARTLGKILHRPSFVPTPAFALRLALGEMADAAILGGQRVRPAVALDHGFEFRYPRLEGALRDLYE